jgi:SAM-dependent methyltransferase
LVGTHAEIYWCGSCRVGYSPPPPRDWLQAEYETVVDPSYLEEEGHRLRNSEWVLSQVERYRAPGALYEVGASVGILLRAAQTRGWTVDGVEPSAWAVATARERYSLRITQGTIESGPGPAGPVDCVVMSDVLEHLVDPQAAVIQAADWLSTGGILAIVTVNMAALPARLLRGRWPGFMDMHLTYFTPRALRSMLRAAGLQPVELRAAPRRLTAGYMGRRLRGTGGPGDLAARVLTLPGIRGTSLTIRSRDLVLAMGQKAGASSTQG